MTKSSSPLSSSSTRHPDLDPSDTFERRHLGPREGDIEEMLTLIGRPSLDDLVGAAIPKSIQLEKPMRLDHRKTLKISRKILPY